MYLTTEVKQGIFKEFGKSEFDTGLTGKPSGIIYTQNQASYRTFKRK
jgi:hypothetical protein